MSDDVRIEFFCSIFYPEALDFLNSLKVKNSKSSHFFEKNGFRLIQHIYELQGSI